MKEESTEMQVAEQSNQLIEKINEQDTFAAKVRVLNAALNQEPLKVKNLRDEMKKNGLNAGKSSDFDYVPIEIVEEALRQIFFRQIDFIIVDHRREINSYVVHGRIQYIDPVTQMQRTVDGIGAKALQQDKGKTVAEIESSMKSNAFELAAPIAYSRAIKNAAKKLGKMFGANLNRDEEIENYKVFQSKNSDEKLIKLSLEFSQKAHLLNADAVERIREIINSREASSYTKALQMLSEV